MDAAINETQETMVGGSKKRKRSMGKMFLNFLMYGGWLAVLVVGMAIYVAISVLTK